MDFLSFVLPESGNQHSAYCRKQKSLNVLCSNFLRLYNREGVASIGLDDAAHKLGVERRRIYDIVNIIESVGVLAKKAKNQYTWKGFGEIPRALDKLKEEGMRDNFPTLVSNTYSRVGVAAFQQQTSLSRALDDDQAPTLCHSNPSSQEVHPNSYVAYNSDALLKADSRRGKSLGMLTENFVKLFLCTNVELISLDEAARILLGVSHFSSIMRTKVRRLYDIANVLSSMNLIEKTQDPITRKPSIRWLGMSGKSNCGSFDSMEGKETHKRAFGTDISNLGAKKSKLDLSIGDYDNQDFSMKVRTELLDYEGLEYESKQGFKTNMRDPLESNKLSPASEHKVETVHDRENPACKFPHKYHNQALNDLFVHYLEAWKSWCVQAEEE